MYINSNVLKYSVYRQQSYMYFKVQADAQAICLTSVSGEQVNLDSCPMGAVQLFKSCSMCIVLLPNVARYRNIDRWWRCCFFASGRYEQVIKFSLLMQWPLENSFNGVIIISYSLVYDVSCGVCRFCCLKEMNTKQYLYTATL